MFTVTELFTSIQGESRRAGEACVFVRLTGCNLRCGYCDTTYAYEGGEELEFDEVVERVVASPVKLVEITGGEPLLQERTPELCRVLQQWGRTVMVETNGSCDIRALPAGVMRVMDIKCPGSGAGGSLSLPNLSALTPEDDCKFVLSDRADFDWACAFVREHDLCSKCQVFFSPAWGRLAPSVLADWIIGSGLPVRLGLQLQKTIWGEERGR